MGGALHLRLLLGLICLCAAAKPVLYDTLDPDVFWHLRVAEQLRAEGIGPLVDHLAAASDKTPWTPYSWLAELGMLRIWEWGGYRGALLVHAVCAGVFVGLVGWGVMCGSAGDLKVEKRTAAEAAPTAAPTVAVVLPVFLGGFLAMPYLSFRPATFALVLLALVYALIQRDRARAGWGVWLVLPVTALLANVHLYAFLVPVWLGCLALEKRRYLWLAGATLLCACATPMLPGVIATIVHYQFEDVLVSSGVIAEMQPFWRGTMGMISAGMVAGAVGWILYQHMVSFTRHRERSEGSTLPCEETSFGYRGWMSRCAQHDGRLADWALLGVSIVLLLMKGRYAPLFAIVGAPMLGRALLEGNEQMHPGRRVARSPAWGAPVMCVVLAAMVVRLVAAFPSAQRTLDQWVNRHGGEAPGYPCEAARFVEAHVTPRTGVIINEFTWGGYLGWRLSPQFVPLMDGRTQCFSQGFWRETYLSDRPNVSLAGDVAVLPRGRSLFRGELKTSGWKKVFGDEWAEVWVPPSQDDALKTLTPTLSRVQERE